MSDTFSADPAALTAHARRLASYQSDLEQASDALRQTSASNGAFGMMVGPFIAPLFQLVEAGEQLALDKLSQSLVASARSFEAREASSSASLSQAGSGLDGGYRGN